MNTKWIPWVIGPVVALAIVANVSLGATPKRPTITVPFLIESKIRQLKDPRFTTRRDAARALAGAHKFAAKVAPALIEALGDEHPEVRMAAGLALRKIAAMTGTSFPELNCSATTLSCVPGLR